jgi:hypothetical protein
VVLDTSAAEALGYRPAGDYATTVAAEIDWLLDAARAGDRAGILPQTEDPYFSRFFEYAPGCVPRPAHRLRSRQGPPAARPGLYWTASGAWETSCREGLGAFDEGPRSKRAPARTRLVARSEQPPHKPSPATYRDGRGVGIGVRRGTYDDAPPIR